MAIKKDALKANMSKSPPPAARIDTSLAALLGSGGAASGTKVLDLDISILDFHPEQSNYSMNADALSELAQSIAEVGVLDPILVQPAGPGRYRILAGHRRTKAAELAGLSEIPAIIKDVDDSTATIIFNATNVYNRELLLSERAYAYAQILEATQAQGATTSRTTANIAEISGENKKTVQRIMRLTYLLPELIPMVDNKSISLYAAVDLSYLSSLSQENLYKVIQTHQIESVSMQQAKDIRLVFDENGSDLTEFQIKEYFSPSETNSSAVKKKKAKIRIIKLPFDFVADFFSMEELDLDIIDTIIEALTAQKGRD